MTPLRLEGGVRNPPEREARASLEAWHGCETEAEPLDSHPPWQFTSPRDGTMTLRLFELVSPGKRRWGENVAYWVMLCSVL